MIWVMAECAAEGAALEQHLIRSLSLFQAMSLLKLTSSTSTNAAGVEDEQEVRFSIAQTNSLLNSAACYLPITFLPLHGVKVRRLTHVDRQELSKKRAEVAELLFSAMPTRLIETLDGAQVRHRFFWLPFGWPHHAAHRAMLYSDQNPTRTSCAVFRSQASTTSQHFTRVWRVLTNGLGWIGSVCGRGLCGEV